jgi:hypothetical protein
MRANVDHEVLSCFCELFGSKHFELLRRQVLHLLVQMLELFAVSIVILLDGNRRTRCPPNDSIISFNFAALNVEWSALTWSIYAMMLVNPSATRTCCSISVEKSSFVFRKGKRTSSSESWWPTIDV